MDRQTLEHILRTKDQTLYNKLERVFIDGLPGNTIPINRMDLRGANLSGSFFRNIDFTGTWFRGTNLAGAEFDHCHLNNTDFAGADLRGARFIFCDMVNVNFAGADLRGAILNDLRVIKDVHLDGTDLRGVTADEKSKPAVTRPRKKK